MIPLKPADLESLKGPWCLVCNKPVDSVMVEPLEAELAYRITSVCHGQRTSMYLPRREAYTGRGESVS